MINRYVIFSLLFVLLAGYISASDILFFNQDCNDDSAGADNTCFDERYNMLSTLIDGGHNVTLLDSFSDPQLANLLNDNAFLMLPELEDVTNCNATNMAFISPSVKTLLVNYVNGGGGVLVTGAGNNIDFLNDVFGLTLTHTNTATMGYSIKDSLEAKGTPFENCSSIIPNFDGTFLVTTTMPDDKRCIYRDETSGHASVAYFNIGAGAVMYVAYDLYDGGPGCTNAASEWIGCILESSIVASEFGITGVPIPTLSEWGIIICFLLFSIVFVLGVRTKVSFV